MSDKQQLVVIGNGMAGARFVEEMVAMGAQDAYDITVVGEEDCGNYNRILLSGVLAGTHRAEDIFINPAGWYAANGVALHSGVRVIGIDRKGRMAYGAGGLLLPYDKLVIATGSSPFLPTLDGLITDAGGYKRGAFVFRTLRDCQEIMDYAAGGAQRAAVIGGGLLGLEAARGLLNRGLEVDVIHLMGWLMDQQLDPQSGDLLQRRLEGPGVRFHLEKLTTAVLGDDAVTGLQFQDGSALDCDLVIIAAGIRPNVDLARMAGLHIRRGILVNDSLACRNDQNIYAIGECAEHRSRIYGLVAPIWEQARVLAERLAGQNAEAAYTGSRVATKLKVMDVELAVAGEKDPVDDGDEVVTYVEPNRQVYKKIIVHGGKVKGAILLGDGEAAPRVLQAFDREETLPDNRAELLFPLGDGVGGGAAGAGVKVADLPDTARICDCNGVTKGGIMAAVDAGNRSLAAVCAATRAGSGCGGCKGQVRAVLESGSGGPAETADGGGGSADGVNGNAGASASVDAGRGAAGSYIPGIALTRTELVGAVKAMQLRTAAAVLSALSGNRRSDAASERRLNALLRGVWGDLELGSGFESGSVSESVGEPQAVVMGGG